MNTNRPRRCGISPAISGTAKSTLVSGTAKSTWVSAATILLLVAVSATGCDQSQTARMTSSPAAPATAEPSIDDRLEAPPSDIRFEAPARIFAGENPVSVDDPGYACPTIADVDGDGADDLVVGQFANGQMKFYRNENKSDQTPKFAEGVWIRTGDDVAEVPGVW